MWCDLFLCVTVLRLPILSSNSSRVPMPSIQALVNSDLCDPSSVTLETLPGVRLSSCRLKRSESTGEVKAGAVEGSLPSYNPSLTFNL
jgi:hypothetical protein